MSQIDLLMRAKALFPHRPYLCRAAVRAARRAWVRAIQRRGVA
jgi:hypothetical protein